MAKVRQSIIECCRSQMGSAGASIVKVCVDEDVRAYASLAKYPARHRSIVARCTRQMVSMAGWSIVKVCADEDIRADEALEGY